jgi:predicted nucleic acid-binding protein
LVVDASVGLKWVLEEPDSHLAEALVTGEETLLVPDFWLNEACNVLWLRVRRRRMSPGDARNGLNLLRAQIPPTPTLALNLHDLALDIGIAVNQSPYDALYVAFAIAMGADQVVAADAAFVRNMRSHPDAKIAGIMLPLDEWAAGAGTTG